MEGRFQQPGLTGGLHPPMSSLGTRWVAPTLPRQPNNGPRTTDQDREVAMGRIWRGLKLGMKSLLLHKLRSGLTVLGIVFGVAAVISMLSIAEGTSRVARDQIRALGATNIIIRSVKPSTEAETSGGNRPSMILNYGLKYSDYDRIVETIPTIRKVLPIREIRKQIRRGSLFLDG